MFFTQLGKQVQRALPVFAGLVREHGGGLHQLAGGIDHGHLNAGANARVQPHGDARPGGCGQKQVAQVVGKHLDRDFFGRFTQLGKQVALGGQAQLDAPGPGHAFADQIVPRAALVAPAQGQGDAGLCQRDGWRGPRLGSGAVGEAMHGCRAGRGGAAGQSGSRLNHYIINS